MPPLFGHLFSTPAATLTAEPTADAASGRMDPAATGRLPEHLMPTSSSIRELGRRGLDRVRVLDRRAIEELIANEVDRHAVQLEAEVRRDALRLATQLDRYRRARQKTRAKRRRALLKLRDAQRGRRSADAAVREAQELERESDGRLRVAEARVADIEGRLSVAEGRAQDAEARAVALASELAAAKARLLAEQADRARSETALHDELAAARSAPVPAVAQPRSRPRMRRARRRLRETLRLYLGENALLRRELARVGAARVARQGIRAPLDAPVTAERRPDDPAGQVHRASVGFGAGGIWSGASSSEPRSRRPIGARAGGRPRAFSHAAGPLGQPLETYPALRQALEAAVARAVHDALAGAAREREAQASPQRPRSDPLVLRAVSRLGERLDRFEERAVSMWKAGARAPVADSRPAVGAATGRLAGGATAIERGRDPERRSILMKLVQQNLQLRKK